MEPYINTFQNQTRYILIYTYVVALIFLVLIISLSLNTLTLPSETLWQAPHRWPSEEDSFHDIAGTETKYVLTYLDEPTRLMIIASSTSIRSKWKKINKLMSTHNHSINGCTFYQHIYISTNPRQIYKWVNYKVDFQTFNCINLVPNIFNIMSI